VNLFLAMFWLLVAIAAFLLSWLEPGLPLLWFAGSDLNVGAIALAFCAYNLVRWLSTRMAAQRRRTREELSAHQHRPRGRPVADSAPNPAFDFSERPPTTGEGAGPGR
jgi:membrane protein implicated in regulation of membrane protease activity